MPAVERTVTTRADVERVWAFLSDFTTTMAWDPPTRETVRLVGDGGVGTTYRNVSHFLGRDVETTYTVVEHRPPFLLRVEGRSSTFTSMDTLLVAARDRGSVVTYTADFTFTGAARLAAPALGLALGQVADAAAARMAGCLDGLVTPQTYAG